MVVLVSLDAPGTVLQIEIKLRQLRQNILVDRHTMVTHHDAAIEWYILDLLAPGMRVDLLQAVSLAGVDVEDLLQ